MLWTIFKIFMIVWMLQIVFHFGGSVIPVVLVISFMALLVRLIIRRISFDSSTLCNFTKTGRFNSATAEQFAGVSKINASFHNRIFKI